ncbi:MAG: signal peptidase II [Rhizobiaceae bacterium]
MTSPTRLFLLSAALTGLDQAVKYLVETNLPFAERLGVIPYLSLYRTWNSGISFSLLAGMPVVALVALTLVVLSLVAYLAMQTRREERLARAGYALILAGATGNLIDRVVHGHVIDYILFHTAQWSFAVFNLADAFISVGAALVVLQELANLAGRKHNKG